MRIKHYRVNILQWPAIFTIYKVSFVSSPLSKELVDRKHEQIARDNLTDDIQEPESNRFANSGQTFLETERTCSELSYWPYYLSRPLEMIRLIKRYHLVGNGFIVYFIVQFVVLIYLSSKAIFHQIFTIRNQQSAQYYAIHYFPRLFESYSDIKYMYGVATVTCLYCLVVRLLMAYKLIRKSIINRNGYKEIDLTQLNLVFLTTLCWKLEDWFRILNIGRKHGKLIARCRHHEHTYDHNHGDLGRERQAHLDLGKQVSHLKPSTEIGAHGLENSIDFSECFKMYGFDMNKESRMIRESWYIPESNCRADLWELAWLVYVVFLGVPSLWGSVICLMILTSLYELTKLTANPAGVFDRECLGQIMNLIKNPNHLIRLIDIQLLILCQIPHHVDAAMTYTNLVIFVSRIRKVVERFQNDLDFCTNRALSYHLAHQEDPSANCGKTDSLRYNVTDCTNDQSGHITDDGDLIQYIMFITSPGRSDLNQRSFPNITTAEKAALNRNLRSNVNLIKSIDLEFKWLRESLTAYFDVLLIGCGFYFSVLFSAILVSESPWTKILMVAAAVSVSYPLAMIVVFAVLIEYRVS